MEAVKQVVSDFIDQREGRSSGFDSLSESAPMCKHLTLIVKLSIASQRKPGSNGGEAPLPLGMPYWPGDQATTGSSSRIAGTDSTTDGANTAGEVPPIKAAELAAKEHIRIYDRYWRR